MMKRPSIAELEQDYARRLADAWGRGDPVTKTAALLQDAAEAGGNVARIKNRALELRASAASSKPPAAPPAEPVVEGLERGIADDMPEALQDSTPAEEPAPPPAPKRTARRSTSKSRK